jgi:hypothetical protein
LPAGDPWQDRVEVPEPPVTLVDESVQIRFVEFVVTARVTVPANPPDGVIEMVEVPETPALSVLLAGFGDMPKSGADVT